MFLLALLCSILSKVTIASGGKVFSAYYAYLSLLQVVVHGHLDMDSAELLTSKGGDDDLSFPVLLETAQSLRYQLGTETL